MIDFHFRTMVTRLDIRALIATLLMIGASNAAFAADPSQPGALRYRVQRLSFSGTDRATTVS